MKKIQVDALQSFKNHRVIEHDACGIVAMVEKKNEPTHTMVKDCLQSLTIIHHRAGFVNGEGDGVGIHMDVPTSLWEGKLPVEQRHLVSQPEFTIAHIFIDQKKWTKADVPILIQHFQQQWDVLFYSTEETNTSALGPLALQDEPLFLQVAMVPTKMRPNLKRERFHLLLELESQFPVHVCSLSNSFVVYKVMGAADTLYHYYKDLQNPSTKTSMILGHNRYSTNTMSSFFRVQPFNVIGHNGEINTIAKLRLEAEQVGVTLTDGGSDSQDLDRLLNTLLHDYDLDLFQALEIVFPPIANEIYKYTPKKQAFYKTIRQQFGHFAQGPAGIISRFENEAVFSNDALGLRPLWMLETPNRFLFCSESGILPVSQLVAEPKPLSPGEKVGIRYDDYGTAIVYEYSQLQDHVFTHLATRIPQVAEEQIVIPVKKETNSVSLELLGAFGWDKEHIQVLEQMAEKGVEPIRSLGHDVPLAALDKEVTNIPDYIKESVAVVTNPAIDRDRETEHFSTRVYLGNRGPLLHTNTNHIINLESPLLVEGVSGEFIYEEYQQQSFEYILSHYQSRNSECVIKTYMDENDTIPSFLEKVRHDVVESVQNGKELIVLDDEGSFEENHLFVDPYIVLATVSQQLRVKNLRRNVAIILRSATIRSLHDVMVAVGLDADAVAPYALFQCVEEETGASVKQLYSAMKKGMEKVISTLGIHELRGYTKLFSAIGLHEEVANVVKIVNYFGVKDDKGSFAYLKEDALKRKDAYKNGTSKLRKSFHLFPRIWKSISDLAAGKGYDAYREKTLTVEKENPITIRHLLQLKQTSNPTSHASLRIGKHDLPFVISSMSFGSQNETAFRAYAEAAQALNMISMNGEGGEIKDMLGKYAHTRGIQIASGRFGINAELLNSSHLIEIKIGQGAKPGEGGHLPASKVTEKIAAARNATVGSDLISPSNNHDIYSIEDLAQMISELKSVNATARIVVKVPVVPNIGTIAVGVAKAGADVISLSGFDGGTGAARIHALTHVGLPIEIGVKASHNALLEANLRQTVEIWADGGIRTAEDVVKMTLLGANRIGFGTLSMIAIGCTTCRGCHLDSCHVGIATQIESEAEAKEHGLRRFKPRVYSQAVQNLLNFFSSMGDEVAALASSLGAQSLQELVGRSDLLVQEEGKDRLDLTTLTNVHELSFSSSEYEDYIQTLGNEMKQNETPNEVEGFNGLGAGTHTKELVLAVERNVGIRTSGNRVKGHWDRQYSSHPSVSLTMNEGSVPGNGFGAYTVDGVTLTTHGGAQDSVAKTAFGGQLNILKAKGAHGVHVHGSVGKSFAYGAQSGTFIVQGNADSRAGIRLSGADLIFGGQVQRPIPTVEHGNVGVHSNLKGFAFEYMTNGRGLVLGDPGPWICAGMTGGTVYLRHQPEMGLTLQALQRRLAKGAVVSIIELTEQGIQAVTELLQTYSKELVASGQMEEANTIAELLKNPAQHFVAVVPTKDQADPAISTE